MPPKDEQKSNIHRLQTQDHRKLMGGKHGVQQTTGQRQSHYLYTGD